MMRPWFVRRVAHARTRALLAALTLFATPRGSLAQDAGIVPPSAVPAPSRESTEDAGTPVEPDPSASGGASNAVALLIPRVAEPDPEQLQKTHQLYDTARKALGGEHVLLTATTFLGKQCQKRAFKDCGRLQAGAAALISVPLIGAGGNHGFDWYPVLQTQDATDAYQAFESQAQEYVALVENADAVVENPRHVLRTLENAARSLFDQTFDDDPSGSEIVKAGRICLQQIKKLRALGANATGTHDAGTRALANELARSWQGGLGVLKRHTDSEKSSDSTPDSPDGVQDMYDACKTLGDLVASTADPKQQLIALVALLKTYWRNLALDAPLTRHAALLGPAIAVPLTQDPTDVVLAGALLELGHPKYSQYFRLGISGGVQLHYARIGGPPGWFVGLALSGALGDDLIHYINGGLSAARLLSTGQ